MFSGRTNPDQPAWFAEHRAILQDLGYTVPGDGTEGVSDYTREIEQVGMEFLGTCLDDPVGALVKVPNVLEQFAPINERAGILTRVTPQQFGIIINIVARRYADAPPDHQHAVMRCAEDFLGWKNSANVPGYTAQIRNWALLRDLVAHWSVINWPNTWSYRTRLEQTTEWSEVQASLADTANNPLLFALAMPYNTVSTHIQAGFRAAYPELSQQGITIVAAGLYNSGAHDEILAQERGPERWISWEDSITNKLERFAPEYRGAILQAIVAKDWNLFDDPHLIFEKMHTMLSAYRLELDPNGQLVRVPHRS